MSRATTGDAHHGQNRIAQIDQLFGFETKVLKDALPVDDQRPESIVAVIRSRVREVAPDPVLQIGGAELEQRSTPPSSNASKARRTISTFSCDIARAVSRLGMGLRAPP